MLQTYSIIKVSGLDAENFLQGQLSNDVTVLNDQTWQLSCYCNQKGRIIAFVWLAYFEEAYYLCLPSSALDLTFTELKKFGAFSKVTIETADNLELAVNFNETTAKIHEKALVIMRQSKDLALAILPAGTIGQQAQESKDIEWHLSNINNSLPIISQVQQEKFTPHQLNLQNKNVIAFKKGCYRGQEIVARMQYLGKLKQQMYRVEIHGDISLEELTTITTAENKNIGEIVNISPIAENTYVALAVLNKAAIEASTSDIIQLKDGQELRVTQ